MAVDELCMRAPMMAATLFSSTEREPSIDSVGLPLRLPKKAFYCYYFGASAPSPAKRCCAVRALFSWRAAAAYCPCARRRLAAACVRQLAVPAARTRAPEFIFARALCVFVCTAEMVLQACPNQSGRCANKECKAPEAPSHL